MLPHIETIRWLPDQHVASIHIETIRWVPNQHVVLIPGSVMMQNFLFNIICHFEVLDLNFMCFP